MTLELTQQLQWCVHVKSVYKTLPSAILSYVRTDVCLLQSLKRGDSGKAAAGAAASILRAGSGGSVSTAAITPGVIPRLAPPISSSSSSSSSGFFRLQPPPPGASSSVAAGAGRSTIQQPQQQEVAGAASPGEMAAVQQVSGPGRASLDGGSTAAPQPAVAEDDWGDFVG